LPRLSGEALKKAYSVEVLNSHELERLEHSEFSGEELNLEKAYLVECKRRAEEKRAEPLSDRDLLHQHVIPWMRENRDWGMIYMHWVDHDNTTAPAFVENSTSPFDDKHHHLTDYVDKNVGDLVQFLKAEDFWQETYLILFSDHGYHLNCTVPDAQEMGRDFCANHMFPHDCFVWDYEKGKTSKIYSGGCRRIFMAISGGALSADLRGRHVEKAEIIDHLSAPVEADIIDIPATIADIYGVPYGGEGESLLSKL
jgi:predicted AlkP superfamily phosphohydrolase/phosphomutase